MIDEAPAKKIASDTFRRERELIGRAIDGRWSIFTHAHVLWKQYLLHSSCHCLKSMRKLTFWRYKVDSL
jgi:hypothetical protein